MPDSASIARYLMSQSSVPTWSLSDANTILRLSAEQVVPRGQKGKIIYQCLSWLHFSVLQFLFMIMVGGFEVIRWWWANLQSVKTPLPTGARIFVGFGAGSEEDAWQSYLKEHDSMSIRINQTIPGAQQGLVGANLWLALKNVFCNAKQVIFGYKNVEGPLHTHKLDFLTIAVSRLGAYSFFCAWWKAVSKFEPREICFMSPDTASHACLAAGLKNTVFRQHGLLLKSIIFPHLHRIETITEDEQHFLQDLLPNCEVVIPIQKKNCDQYSKTLILAAHNVGEMPEAFALIDWALSKDFKVIVRPHPAGGYDGNYWKQRYPNVQISSTTENFEQLLFDECPLFIASWISTTMVQALKGNIIPISLESADNEIMQDMVYPILERTYHWPECKPILEKATEDPEEYTHALEKLRYRSVSCG